MESLQQKRKRVRKIIKALKRAYPKTKIKHDRHGVTGRFYAVDLKRTYMNEPKCAAVLLGPPGSGKTTLARTLAGRNGISVIETGNLLEQEIRHGTPLGLQIKPYKIEGALVPSELVRQVITGE